MTVRTIDEIFRDFVTDGVPASGPFNPHKPDIRDTLKALTEGSENFPDNRVIRLNNADEGTANNIVVTASVAVPAAAYQVLYILNVTQENTGPVTISGAISRSLVTNTNQPVPAGYLTPGMALLCIDTGTELRLLSYGDAEAILAAAEDAAARAEAAAAGLNLPLIEPGDAGKSLVVNDTEDGYTFGDGGFNQIFDNIASAQAARVPSIVKIIETVNDAGSDRLGGKYSRVSSEPTGKKLQTADGAWWSFVGFRRPGAGTVARPYVQKVADIFTPKDYGALGDGTASDNKLADAVLAAMNENKTLIVSGDTPATGYSVSSPIIIDLSDTTSLSDRKRPAIRGESTGTSRINYTGTGGLFQIKGDNGASEGHHMWIEVSDLTLVGPGMSTSSIAFQLDHTAYFHIDRVDVENFGYGIYAIDIEFSKFTRSAFKRNGRGAFLTSRVPADVNSSWPNGNGFIDCEISLNKDYGIQAIGATQLSLRDCHVQYNGLEGGAGRWGVRVDNACYQGGVGLNVSGGYFEHNGGLACIVLATAGTDVYPTINSAVHNVIGASFSRVTSAGVPQAPAANHILCSFNGNAGPQKLNVIGSNFKYYNLYTPNASNKVIAFDEAVSPMSSENFFEAGNLYQSAIEAPSYPLNKFNGLRLTPQSALPANPLKGTIILSNADNLLYVWIGTEWKKLTYL